MGRRVIAVTGLPGAWLNHVSAFMVTQGCKLVWPRQDSDLRHFHNAVSGNGENPEVSWIHNTILERHGQGLFTDQAPLYYDVPYPGPQEIINQFSSEDDILLADNRLCLFMPIWRPWVTDVIVCEYPQEESARTIARWTNSFSLDRQRWTQQVALHFRDRLQYHIDGMPSVTILSHTDMVSGRYRELLRSLKSTF